MDESLRDLKVKVDQDLESILAQEFLREKSLEKLRRFINMGMNNQEILEKIVNFPNNYISEEVIKLHDLDTQLKNTDVKLDNHDEHLNQSLMLAIEKVRIENILLNLPAGTIQKIVKKTSKAPSLKLQAFRSSLYESGLISVGDADLINKLSYEQFEKYSHFEDPEAEEMEQLALEQYVDTPNDQEIKDLVFQDSSSRIDDVVLGVGESISDVSVDFFDDGLLGGISETVSTGKELTELAAKKLSFNQNIPLAVARDMTKKYYFMMKKEEENNIKFKEKLIKKQRTKEIKKQQKEITKKNLEFTNFDKIQKKTIKKLKDDFGPLIRISKSHEKDEEDYTIKEKAFEVYKGRTLQNFTLKIEDVILKDLTHIEKILGGYEWQIDKFDVNNGITIIKIHWALKGDRFNTQEPSDEIKNIMETLTSKLNQYAVRNLNAQIFQTLGLKKPVECRFIYSRKNMMMNVMKKDIGIAAKRAALSQIESKIKEGELKSGDVDQQMIKKYFDANLSNLSNNVEERYIFKDKNFFDKKKGRIRNHKKPDGSRNKHKKMDEHERTDKFWNSLR